MLVSPSWSPLIVKKLTNEACGGPRGSLIVEAASGGGVEPPELASAPPPSSLLVVNNLTKEARGGPRGSLIFFELASPASLPCCMRTLSRKWVPPCWEEMSTPILGLGAGAGVSG